MAVAELKNPSELMDDWMSKLPGNESRQPKAPDGKTDPPQRSDPPEPPVKPAVSSDGKGGEPSKVVGDGTKPDGGKPADKTDDKSDAGDDWEKASPPKGASQKDWDKWKANRKESETKLKAEVKAREDKLTELQGRLTESEKKAQASEEVSPVLKAKIEKYEADIKALSDRIIYLDVKEHPDFQSHYGGLINGTIAEAKALVGEEKAVAIESILKQPEGEYKKTQLSQFLADMESDDDRDELRAIARDLKKVEREREFEIKKASDNRAKLTAEKQSKLDESKKARDAVFSQVAKSMQDPEKGFAPFQVRPDDPVWNEEVEKRMATTKALLTGEGLKPELLVKAAFFASALPTVLQSYHTEAAKWKEEKAGLEKTISELKAAQPGPGSNANNDSEPGKLKLTPDMDPVAVTKAWARAAREAANG